MLDTIAMVIAISPTEGKYGCAEYGGSYATRNTLMRFSTTPKMMSATARNSQPTERRTALLSSSRKGATTPTRISTTSDVVAAGRASRSSASNRYARSPNFSRA